MTTTLKRSSWISEIGYRRAPDNTTWLAVFTFAGPAILYRDVPATLPGLIAAGRVKTKDGERLSHGAAYNRLVKGRYVGQTVSDPKEVEYLRQAMEAL